MLYLNVCALLNAPTTQAIDIYTPAGRIGYTKHSDAFSLILIHQIIIFLNLLIWPVRSHFQPVIQSATAGLQ